MKSRAGAKSRTGAGPSRPTPAPVIDDGTTAHLPPNAIAVREHAAAVRVATDPEGFSNAVSRFVQIPNGLDGAEHARFRALIDRYFTPEAMAEFAPACRTVAKELVAALPRDRAVDAVGDIGAPYAVRAQSAWLGWPGELERPLLEWLDDKLEAMRTGDPARAAELAERFDALVLSVVEPRRASDGRRDVTDRLVHDTYAGRPLSDAELVSILRNWTGGDLGSLALCVGVVVHFLATHPDIADRLRDEPSSGRVDEYLEEMLRLEDPFVASRRVARRDTAIGDLPVGTGQLIALEWAAANRDPGVFDPPDRFDPERNCGANLVYGVGPHVCPGRPLARLELREIIRALLAASPAIALADAPLRETPPLGGFRSVPVLLAPSSASQAGRHRPSPPPLAG